MSCGNVSMMLSYHLEPVNVRKEWTGTLEELTAGNSSYSGSAPIAPFPIAIFTRLTGGSGVEKIAFVM